MKITICAPLSSEDMKKIQDAFPGYEYVRKDVAEQEDLDTSDIIIGNPALSLNLNRENLKALLLCSAGSDPYVAEGVLNPATKLANASGTYGSAISEQVIGMMIALNKNLMQYHDLMKEQCWKPLSTGKEIFHSRVCIVGLGDLGYEAAKRLKAFNCHITAVKRREMTKALPCIDKVVTFEKLDEVLPESDFVILALPQNASTYHMFDKDRLLKMKKDAVLINVGRGSAVDTEDLIEVLEMGHLYGAGLDVVEEEPLSKESKLWTLPNVLITPHSSGGFVWNSVHEHYTELVIRNLAHLKAQEALENEVDFETGYRKEVIYQ